MKFNVLSDAELAKKRCVIVEGEADFTIERVEEKVSKRGNDMFEIQLKVWDKNGTDGSVRDYIVSTAEWKIHQLCDAINEPSLYKSGEIKPDLLEGKSGRCAIILDKTDRGEYPKVKMYLSYVDPMKRIETMIKKPDENKASLPNFDEDGDIPF